ncbi:MAG: hypothetical protein KA885_05175 [Spirochaetes bacterium]|nr:hypothetical protein [Spirochaetota bacterium]
MKRNLFLLMFIIFNIFLYSEDLEDIKSRVNTVTQVEGIMSEWNILSKWIKIARNNKQIRYFERLSCEGEYSFDSIILLENMEISTKSPKYIYVIYIKSLKTNSIAAAGEYNAFTGNHLKTASFIEEKLIWYLKKEEALECLKRYVDTSSYKIGDIKPFFKPRRTSMINYAYLDWFWAISVNKESENRNPVDIYLINPLCIGAKTRNVNLIDNTVRDHLGKKKDMRIYKLSSEEDIDKFINFFKYKEELKKRSNTILSDYLLFQWMPLK